MDAPTLVCGRENGVTQCAEIQNVASKMCTKVRKERHEEVRHLLHMCVVLSVSNELYDCRQK
jgi:hypothetical protein